MLSKPATRMKHSGKAEVQARISRGRGDSNKSGDASACNAAWRIRGRHGTAHVDRD